MLIKHKVGGAYVRYVEDYPIISPVASFEEQFQTQLSYKSHSWKNEEEIRLFKIFGAKTIFQIPVSVIKEIILGCNISESDKEEIIQYVKSKLPHTKISQSKIARGKFELSFEELS